MQLLYSNLEKEHQKMSAEMNELKTMLTETIATITRDAVVTMKQLATLQLDCKNLEHALKNERKTTAAQCKVINRARMEVVVLKNALAAYKKKDSQLAAKCAEWEKNYYDAQKEADEQYLQQRTVYRARLAELGGKYEQFVCDAYKNKTELDAEICVIEIELFEERDKASYHAFAIKYVVCVCLIFYLYYHLVAMYV